MSFATAIIHSLICIYLLSLFAEYVAWALIAGVQAGLIGATFFCFGRYLEWHASDSKYEQENALPLLVGGVSFAVLSLVFVCMIYCGYDQLKTAIDVLDASADFLAGTKRIFLVPIFYFFVQLLFIFLFLGSLISILCTGDITPDDY